MVIKREEIQSVQDAAAVDKQIYIAVIASVILIAVIVMKIGASIKRLLAQRDITQKEFAANLNIPYTTLNGYLRDTYEPDIEMVKRIATTLGVSIDLLLDNETPQSIRLDKQPFPAPSVSFYIKANPLPGIGLWGEYRHIALVGEVFSSVKGLVIYFAFSASGKAVKEDFKSA